jgi:hypothetical protein
MGLAIDDLPGLRNNTAWLQLAREIKVTQRNFDKKQHFVLSRVKPFVRKGTNSGRSPMQLDK